MHSNLKILLIDDDEEDYMLTRELIADITKPKIKLEWANSYEEALRLIDKNTYDVFLVDFRLGAHNGIDLIKEITKKDVGKPCILLTSQIDNDLDNLALDAGASDFLEKGEISVKELERSIRYSLEHAIHLKEITTLNTELEKRVVERTEELAVAIEKLANSKRELMHSLEKEKQLNELKSRFVTMASHEFRTPLGAILSSVSLIAKYEENTLNEKSIKHIDRIKSSVKNLTEILNDFISLEKLEEGKMSVNFSEFNFKELCTEVIAEHSVNAKFGQQISYQHSGEETVILDMNKCKNILNNLISNAIKYTPEGKEITIQSAANKKQLTLEVCDSGIGIPEEEQTHLFERFFRANNVINIEGTGLGLNIVKKYVELMDGSVDFKSELNKGTCFYISLRNQTNTK